MRLTYEFDKQVQNLLYKQYPKLTGNSETEFIEKLEPLRTIVEKLDLPKPDTEDGYLPFVIVVSNKLLASKIAMSLVEKDHHNGITKLYPLESSDFKNTPQVNIPNNNLYLLIDIDRGKDSINIPPNEALTTILDNHRSPLTIDEGIAIVTHYPEFLVKNNCFSLLGSRHSGDKRVPAIWINSSKQPKLGWCWDGNPHTWLGSASCRTRLHELSL